MIFLNAILEKLVQVNDMTRIDLSKSFYNVGEITDITVSAETGETPISIFNVDKDKWFLDWAYSTDGSKVIAVSATDGTNTVAQNFNIEVVTEVTDFLYSNDSQLFSIETDLKRYIPRGHNSFNYVHREAQSRVLMYLDRKRIWNDNGDPLVKTQLSVDEVTKWSLYEAAAIIYTDLFISGGDKFATKVNDYTKLRDYEKERAALRIDKNNNGTIDSSSEIQDTKSFRLIKR